jgi:hypothetical protein
MESLLSEGTPRDFRAPPRFGGRSEFTRLLELGLQIRHIVLLANPDLSHATHDHEVS